MAPQTRRMAFPNVVIERDEDSEESSSSEEEEMEEEVEEEEEIEEAEKIEEKIEGALVAKKKEKTPITISLKKVCKVRPLSIFLSPHNPLIFPISVLCLCSVFYVGVQENRS